MYFCNFLSFYLHCNFTMPSSILYRIIFTTLLFTVFLKGRANQETGWLVSAIQWRTSTNINGRSAATMWPAGEAGILTSPFKKWSQKHFKTPTYSTQIPPIPVSHLTYFLLFPKMFFFSLFSFSGTSLCSQLFNPKNFIPFKADDRVVAISISAKAFRTAENCCGFFFLLYPCKIWQICWIHGFKTRN